MNRRQLEKTMDSVIATTSDTSSMRRVIHRPEEISSTYPILEHITATALHSELQAHLTELVALTPLMKQAEIVRHHLGTWPSDYYWKMILPEKINEKAEREVEKERLGAVDKAEQARRDKKSLDAALRLVQHHHLEPPSLTGPHLSTKVLSLIEHLQVHFDHDSRCIIFVQERITARLLAAVLQHVPKVRSASLTGGGSNAMGDTKTTLKRQVLPLAKFRTGEVNCLVATSVAEEGLDIPDCNLVIRFDPSGSMIQYVQSRGRARSKNSTMIHMLEAFNVGHIMTLAAHRRDEQKMREYCDNLPADRYLFDAESEGDQITAIDGEIFVEPKTGAKMTYTNSMMYLGHFVATLPNHENGQLNPIFAVRSVEGEFICEVILPTCSPLTRATGRVCKRKKLARASAAFRAVTLLYEKQQLDGHLLPIYRKMVNAMRNAQLAKAMDNRGNYEVRLKPEIWRAPSEVTIQLHFILLDFPDGLDRPHQPMLLVSRHPLPCFPRFPLYLDSGRPTEVVTSPVTVTNGCPDSDLEMLTSFTLLIFKDLYRKVYRKDAASMPYWLAPATQTELQRIDWLAIERATCEDNVRWSQATNASELVDRLLLDTATGGNRCITSRLAPEYKPFDPVPPETTPLSDKRRLNTNIVSSSCALFGQARAARSWDASQPVLEAQRVSYRINLLATPSTQDVSKPSKCFVCPEPLVISRLPVKVVATCLAFPAVIHRIDEYLICHEACQRLGLDIDIALALEAFTKDSDHTDADTAQEVLNVRYVSGMGPNYERLELLGDTLLKMATTIAVYIQNANDDESESHIKRMLMLCNRNLANVAKSLSLYEYIRTRAFSRRTWYPQGLELLEGKATHAINSRPMHTLAEKSIADVAEALMGAAFASHHTPGRWNAESLRETVRAVSRLVDAEEHTMQQWADYSATYIKPKYQVTTATAAHVDLAERIEKLHPYHFRYPRLLRSALLHPSMPQSWESIPSYERLEFLGDALLDAVCVEHLFYSYPGKDPQWLTEHKMPMVSNRFLGTVCVTMGLHRHLRHNNAEIQAAIANFEEELEQSRSATPDSVDYWLTISEPPKCLADVIEAYIGAVFIDSDFDMDEVQRFFDLHMRRFFVDMSVYDAYANNHPMIKLQNTMEQVYGCKDFRLMAQALPTGDGNDEIMAAVMIHRTIVGGAIGSSERYTRVRAAQTALDELEGLITAKFRERFGCKCSGEGLQA